MKILTPITVTGLMYLVALTTTVKADVFDFGVIDNYSCHVLNVPTKWAKIKQRKSNNSKTIGLAINNSAVTTKHELGKIWAKVKLNSGKKGMIKWANLETSTKCGIVNKRKKLNLHSKPSLKSRVLERMTPYSGLLILNEDIKPVAKWLAVKTNKNRNGFVQAEFILID